MVVVVVVVVLGGVNAARGGGGASMQHVLQSADDCSATGREAHGVVRIRCALQAGMQPPPHSLIFELRILPLCFEN